MAGASGSLKDVAVVPPKLPYIPLSSSHFLNAPIVERYSSHRFPRHFCRHKDCYRGANKCLFNLSLPPRAVAMTTEKHKNQS